MTISTKISERDERLRKLKEIKESGVNPYPAKTKRTHTVKQVLDNFEVFEKEKTAIFASGRLRSLRTHGNLTFCNLQDGKEQIQLAFSKKELSSEESYKFFIDHVDVGDFLEVSGECFVTHKGENSLIVREWKILSKAILPLPEKWHGLKDEEDKLRKRYLDILFNNDTRELFERKSIFWNSVRRFLLDKGFLEVETPVLEVTTGGADARPFITHHNSLDMEVFLRISMGELWQKKLMVAGFEKTFEIGRQFRNEGMSTEHLQDYTQVEFYWAYADYEDGMKLTEEMYKFVAQETFGTLKFSIRGHEVDMGKPWERYDYQETVKKFTGVDILQATEEEIKNKLHELKIDFEKEGFNITRAIDNLWKYCRKQISGPGFLVGVPVVVSPLAKRVDDRPEVSQRFQPIIAGSELGNGYSELNDPIDQAERFSAQQKLREAGDDEAQMFDHDFVEALEHGMPPTCGFGMSERVFAFLANKPVRECQIFPLLKPKDNAPTANSSKKDLPDLGIAYNEANILLDKYIKDNITKLHCLESEAIMRALAKRFGEDEEKWGIIGLLHDIDWELTKTDPKEHCVKAVDILKENNASQFLIDVIISHAYGMEQIPAYAKLQRKERIEHALIASETLTGLIIASMLMQPEKKLSALKLDSLKKKFKNKKFAANCNREFIMECEKIGLSIDEFLAIGLEALQGISNKLGF